MRKTNFSSQMSTVSSKVPYISAQSFFFFLHSCSFICRLRWSIVSSHQTMPTPSLALMHVRTYASGIVFVFSILSLQPKRKYNIKRCDRNSFSRSYAAIQLKVYIHHTFGLLVAFSSCQYIHELQNVLECASNK